MLHRQRRHLQHRNPRRDSILDVHRVLRPGRLGRTLLPLIRARPFLRERTWLARHRRFIWMCSPQHLLRLWTQRLRHRHYPRNPRRPVRIHHRHILPRPRSAAVLPPAPSLPSAPSPSSPPPSPPPSKPLASFPFSPSLRHQPNKLASPYPSVAVASRTLPLRGPCPTLRVLGARPSHPRPTRRIVVPSPHPMPLVNQPDLYTQAEAAAAHIRALAPRHSIRRHHPRLRPRSLRLPGPRG